MLSASLGFCSSSIALTFFCNAQRAQFWYQNCAHFEMCDARQHFNCAHFEMCDARQHISKCATRANIFFETRNVCNLLFRNMRHSGLGDSRFHFHVCAYYECIFSVICSVICIFNGMYSVLWMHISVSAPTHQLDTHIMNAYSVWYAYSMVCIPTCKTPWSCVFESRVFIENWKWVSKRCGSYFVFQRHPRFHHLTHLLEPRLRIRIREKYWEFRELNQVLWKCVWTQTTPASIQVCRRWKHTTDTTMVSFVKESRKVGLSWQK